MRHLWVQHDVEESITQAPIPTLTLLYHYLCFNQCICKNMWMVCIYLFVICGEVLAVGDKYVGQDKK